MRRRLLHVAQRSCQRHHEFAATWLHLRHRTTINTAKRAMNDRAAEETNDPLIADHRNFYKVEKWTKDGARSTTCSMPAATWTRRGNSSQRRSRHRPRIRLTIRQSSQVLEQWPKATR